MQLPKPGSSPYRCYLCGRYVARRLIRASFPDLHARVDGVNKALLAAYRHAQDEEAPLEEAHADRDVVDDGLDTTVRLARKDLGSRSLRAEREAPYVLVFPNGIGEYVRARIAEQVSTYQRLCSRILAHLAPTDPLCTSSVPEVQRRLVSWNEAVQEVNLKSQALDIAETRLDVAVKEWEQALTEIYGLLIARVGKEEAERFFPRERGRKRKETTETAEDDTPTEEGEAPVEEAEEPRDEAEAEPVS